MKRAGSPLNLPHVLLADDEKSMQLLVQQTISDICQLQIANSLEEAKWHLEKTEFSLLLLDVIFPKGNGFEFCQKLRAQPRYRDLPIIFVTGQTDIDHRVYGFSLGADDYIVKPWNPEELRARVSAKLKRINEASPRSSFQKGNLKVDLFIQKVFLIDEKGQETDLALTPTELKLLSHFLQNVETVYSKEELLTTVWGDSVHVSGHTFDTHISALRKKLGTYGGSLRYIPKKGYCFTTDDTGSKE